MKKYETVMREADKKISEQMQDGFNITSDSFSVRKFYNDVTSGKIHDAPYQRGVVWDNPRKKALIESIICYGGKKVPAVTLRSLDDGTMEIVDGKQRILSAVVPFVQNNISLNGILTPEFEGYQISDIEENYPLTYSAFMTTEIPVLILSDMSDEEAIIYFHQVNSSGVKMNCGETIHAMQGTPLVDAIKPLSQHNVWENITYLKRYNEYEYIARMLLFVKDSEPTQKIFYGDSNKNKLLLQLEPYRSTKLPKEVVQEVKSTLDFMEEMFNKNEFSLSIREFYNLFIYVSTYRDTLNVLDFSKFINELYYFLHNSESTGMNRFRRLKDKHHEKGFSYNSEYYKWYMNELNVMYAKFLKGVGWNEIQKISYTSSR